MITISAINELVRFRDELYACLERRPDALFDLIDAILTGGPLPSLAHLSLEATHRRGWGSLYAALAFGIVNVQSLHKLVGRHPLQEGQPIFAVDVSVWPRCDAVTSPQRGYYYHASRHLSGKPIVAGWAYQLIAQLNLRRDSWTAPLDALRLDPNDDTETIAVRQIKALLSRQRLLSVVPLFVFDGGYNSAALTLGLADVNAAILLRLRADRVFYADPPPPKPTGRPPRYGAKFNFKDATTWWTPTAEYSTEDQQYGSVRVRAWKDLHPQLQNHPTRGTRGPKPIVPGTIILVNVSRLPGRTQKPEPLWLWWHGPGPLDLSLIWRAYVRRFDLEHTIRFFKQILNWTLPQLRMPEQADRWTWLVVAAYTQLRLTLPCAVDKHLPWERSLHPDKLTPNRVRRAFSDLLPVLGTPASAPKPWGKSPGRPKGRRSQPAVRYPVVKKSA